MNKIVLIFVVVVLVVIAGGVIFFIKFPANNANVSPTPTASSAVSGSPENAMYQIGGDLVTLKNGLSQVQTPGSSAVTETKIFGQPVYGDLNGDGINDAGVLLVYTTGGSGIFYYAAAAIVENGKFHGTNAILLGDRVAPQNIEIKDGVLIANYADRKPGEPFTTQPSVGISKYMNFAGGVLKEQIAGLHTFNSTKLGITFQYNSQPTNQITVGIKETGSKVYVYTNSIKPEQGQWVEVFTKKTSETFEVSIKRQILANFPSNDCKIEVSTASDYPSGFMKAIISYPPPANTNDPYWANQSLCNEKYDVTNGIRYFLYDPTHTDKFLYFDIGQYAITAHENEPWQNTTRFLP